MLIVGMYVWWEGQGHGDTSSETSHAIGENLGFITYASLDFLLLSQFEKLVICWLIYIISVRHVIHSYRDQ